MLIDLVLDIFNWVDLKIVLSFYEIELINDENLVFIGLFFVFNIKFIEYNKNKIIVYMGIGIIFF